MQSDMSQAFETLRRYSRTHNEHLSKVAERVIAGTIDMTALAPAEETDPSARRPGDPPAR
jgi:hypothetical protein